MTQKNYESHWSGTSYQVKFFIVTPAFMLPVPILFFFHPTWFVIASVIWMGLVFWLAKKGLGPTGLMLLIRRWLQGDDLRPKSPHTTQ